MASPSLQPRPGMTLVELLVALVVTGVIAAGLTGFFTSQMQLMQQQESLHDARRITRAAANLFQSELRRIEATGGLEHAAARRLTLRVPYALGVVCSTDASGTTVGLLPVDSMMYASAGFSGYAWRDANGGYVYEDVNPSVDAGDPAVCSGAGVEVFDARGGRSVRVSPAAPAAATAGTPAFLYQRIEYELRTIAASGGQSALWRTVLAADSSELIASPFTPGTRFRFHVPGALASQETPPGQLDRVRGIELVFQGRGRPTRAAPSGPTAALTTSVFFKNRIE